MLDFWNSGWSSPSSGIAERIRKESARLKPVPCARFWNDSAYSIRIGKTKIPRIIDAGAWLKRQPRNPRKKSANTARESWRGRPVRSHSARFRSHASNSNSKVQRWIRAFDTTEAAAVVCDNENPRFISTQTSRWNCRRNASLKVPDAAPKCESWKWGKIAHSFSGPSVTPELPSCVAGPPFGAAPLLCAWWSSSSQDPIACEINVSIQVHLHAGVLQATDQ